MSWMEALCPGSSESITRFQPPPPPPLESPPPNQTLGYPQEPSPPPYDSTFVRGDPPPPPTTNNHHSFSPEERNSVPPGGTQWPRADPNTYIRSPVLSPQPDFEEEEDDDDGDDFIPASLTATLPSSFTAQEYMLPSDLETQSLKNPPIPKVHQRPQRGMSDPNVVKPKPSPRPRRNQTLGQLRTPRAPPAPLDTSSMPDDSTYVTMIPSPVHKRLPPIQSKDGRQPNYLEVVQSDDDPVLDGDNYVLSEPASIPLESATAQTRRAGVYLRFGDRLWWWRQSWLLAGGGVGGRGQRSRQHHLASFQPGPDRSSNQHAPGSQVRGGEIQFELSYSGSEMYVQIRSSCIFSHLYSVLSFP